jgi:hypothetical protein
MREVYSGMDSASVGLRQALLKEAGIECFVQNQNLSSTVNAFAGPFQAKLCVGNADYAAAMEVLRSLDESETPDWTCPQCKETVPGAFDSCWNCQTEKPSN